MYRITTSDNYQTYVDEPIYVKLSDEGFYKFADQSSAEGVVVNGKVYSLPNSTVSPGDLVIENLNNLSTAGTFNDLLRIASTLLQVLAKQNLLDSGTISDNLQFFSEWTTNYAYVANSVVRYQLKLYQCITAHTSQDSWTQDVSTSLSTQIADPTAEFPKWSQPLGAVDAYNIGDKVEYNDAHYSSIVNSNVWAPDVYGWETVNSPTAQAETTEDTEV